MIEEPDDIPASPEEEQPKEPRSSKPYLDAILVAEKAFADYNQRADNIDKLYASLSAKASVDRDREFAMFWANIQVLAPSIYSRPPVPIATTRWKNRSPVPRAAAEMLERDLVITFEQEDIDGIMRLVRDDLAISGRGVSWLRYDTNYGKDKVCIEHVDRKDFAHNPARKWKEVEWVGRRSWLTKREMTKRFGKVKSDEATYSIVKEDREKGASDERNKAAVWEIWHKTKNKVIWVTPNYEKVLDEDKPHLTLEGFFPCPKPAYGTVERGSLVPIPDYVMYKDQLEEINELTARIGAMQQALRVRGFYPAGAGDVGDAIETAVKSLDDRTVMVPISNWSLMGGGNAKDMIVWMPIDQISSVITDCVNLRRQYIEDVYQITGLSDIMRGSTDPNETLGAQQLKSQYGSIRVRDRQNELVRVAKDIAVIAAEIMAENFSSKALLDMSQMELKTDKDVKGEIDKVIQQAEQQAVQQITQIRQQAMQQAQQPPQGQPGQPPQQGQQPPPNPQAIQQQVAQQEKQLLAQLEQQTQAQVDKINEQPTAEKVIKLLRDERIRPFSLDIETDSTIQPDEDAEKQRRSEMTAALGGLMREMGPMIQQQPDLAKFGGQFMKFAMGAFRSNRELDTAMDELIENMEARAGQPQPPNPEAEAMKAEMAFKEKELQGKQQEGQAKMQIEMAKLEKDGQGAQQERDFKMQEMQAEAQRDNQKHQHEMQMGQFEMEKIRAEIELLREKAQMQAQTEQIKVQAMQDKAQIDQQSAIRDSEIKANTAQQQADIQAQTAEQNAQHQEQSFQQKSALTEQQAAMRPKGGV